MGIRGSAIADIEIHANEHAKDLPPTVLKEVFDAMNVTVWPQEPQSCYEAVDQFECSRIIVGLNPDMAQGLYEDYTSDFIREDLRKEIPPGSRAVAVWNSGITMGCTTVLFLRPDGTFYWTVP